jgi:hypothetical protein
MLHTVSLHCCLPAITSRALNLVKKNVHILLDAEIGQYRETEIKNMLCRSAMENKRFRGGQKKIVSLVLCENSNATKANIECSQFTW